MQITVTLDVSFAGAVESLPLEEVVVLADSADVSLGVQRALSARVQSIGDDGNGSSRPRGDSRQRPAGK